MKAMRWRLHLSGTLTDSERCYRPLVNRPVVPAPPSGPFSPYCATIAGRYAGQGWWVQLPATMTRTGGASYLRQGDRSSAVYQLQYTLRYCYKSRLALDAVYGPQTKAVVQAVQRLHGLKADGVYGPATMRAMYWQLTRPTPSYPRSQKCYSPF